MFLFANWFLVAFAYAASGSPTSSITDESCSSSSREGCSDKTLANHAVQHAEYSVHDGYIPYRNALAEDMMTVEEAKGRCENIAGCIGFMFQGSSSAQVPVKVSFKNSSVLTGHGSGWSTFRRIDMDNNAPRPASLPADLDIPSKEPGVLPGVAPDRLHGLLGLLPDGTPRYKPSKWPEGGLSVEERREAHRGFCFNSRKSDSESLDRKQPEARTQECIRASHSYPTSVPGLQIASICLESQLVLTVVIVFHIEHFAPLMRSVMILVDDASTVDEPRFSQSHWVRLQDELTEYAQHLPKVILVRLKQRRGLMQARMEAIWRATGDAVVFWTAILKRRQPGWSHSLRVYLKILLDYLCPQ
ncbi:unnamed protein product [Polarella glacialis]|uniref:Glycosyltransferase 2-like domain-containing protein n=1 Tax=Polarella glacialis TaxID=89957 RepID=A0A813FU45_POLGL|nr:unnamed protein product [Polarella glacialis]